MDTNTHAQIIEILDSARDMTLATVRADGFPQATVVAFVHDDVRLYFRTGLASQKAGNIAFCDRVSATITKPYSDWESIEGLSLGGIASEVRDETELRNAKMLLGERHPVTDDPATSYVGEVAVFRVDPVVISLLDYNKGIGHTELIEVEEKLPS